MAFLIPHYYRRRFSPEIEHEVIKTAQYNLIALRDTLNNLDAHLRVLITRISRTYQIPMPGTGVTLSAITSPTQPTGDSTRDQARLLLLYLRAVLSKQHLRHTEKTLEKLSHFEKHYFDEEEMERDNTGFWKRMRLSDDQIIEGISLANSWKDTTGPLARDREKEWSLKVKEMKDAIKEGIRWEQEVAMTGASGRSRRASLVGSIGGGNRESLASSLMSGRLKDLVGDSPRNGPRESLALSLMSGHLRDRDRDHENLRRTPRESLALSLMSGHFKDGIRDRDGGSESTRSTPRSSIVSNISCETASTVSASDDSENKPGLLEAA